MAEGNNSGTPEIWAAGIGRKSNAQYGSDLMVEMLRELGIKYIALNPGASYRGLHDSIVNFESGKGPEMIMCTHEEIAVALANGYARATARSWRRDCTTSSGSARQHGNIQRLVRPHADSRILAAAGRRTPSTGDRRIGCIRRWCRVKQVREYRQVRRPAHIR